MNLKAQKISGKRHSEDMSGAPDPEGARPGDGALPTHSLSDFFYHRFLSF